MPPETPLFVFFSLPFFNSSVSYHRPQSGSALNLPSLLPFARDPQPAPQAPQASAQTHRKTPFAQPKRRQQISVSPATLTLSPLGTPPAPPNTIEQNIMASIMSSRNTSYSQPLKIRNYNDEMVKMVEKRNHHLAIMEYRNDIHNHLVQLDFELEENLLKNPLQDQVKILRNSILNSLLDVCYRLNWYSSTFSLAVHLFDTYTSNKKIEINNCRLIGFCCLWISSKYNENKPKGNLINALLKRAGYEQSAKPTFLKIEFDILKTTNWDLSYPTPEIFLDVFLNTGEPNNLERRLGSMFLCDIALFNLELASNYSSSSIAASSIMITNFAMLNLRHKHIRQHRFDELESLILNQVVKMESSIKLKYLDSNIISHSNNNMVIHNLIYLAQCFVKQKEEEKEHLKKLKQLKELDLNLNPNLYYNSNGYLLKSSLNENGNLSFFPISPMASPTNLPNNVSFRPSPTCSSASSSASSPYYETDSSNSSMAINSNSNKRLHKMDSDDSKDHDLLGRHSRSHSLRNANILPTPGTTPTATFSWMGNSASSTTSVDYDQPQQLEDSKSNINSNVDLSQQINNSKLTPQIFTPVQLLPHNLLYSMPPTHLHGHSLSSLSHTYSQRYEYNRSTSPEILATKRVARQKYQRTLPVVTRSRAKESVVGYSGNSGINLPNLNDQVINTYNYNQMDQVLKKRRL